MRDKWHIETPPDSPRFATTCQDQIAGCEAEVRRNQERAADFAADLASARNPRGLTFRSSRRTPSWSG